MHYNRQIHVGDNTIFVHGRGKYGIREAVQRAADANIDQNQINQLFANAMRQQQEQRENDVQTFEGLRRNVNLRLQEQRAELEHFGRLRGINEASQEELQRQIGIVRARIAAGENLIGQIEQSINQFENNPEVVRIREDLNRMLREAVVNEEERDAKIARIREQLNAAIERHCTQGKELNNLEAVIVALGGTTMVLALLGAPVFAVLGEKAIAALLMRTVVRSSISQLGWARMLYHKSKTGESKYELDVFNRYVAEGLSPELALEIAKKMSQGKFTELKTPKPS